MLIGLTLIRFRNKHKHNARIIQSMHFTCWLQHRRMNQCNVSEVSCVISSEFVAWLQANGVVAYDIKAAYVAEGWRGIAAVNQLPAGVSWISYLLRAMQLL